jgi:hypothetical protein
MSPEPRHEGDYSDRQIDAAHRVLVDVGQVLASFGDAIVVVGGWVPDLLMPNAVPEHIGSIDVDLALDAATATRASRRAAPTSVAGRTAAWRRASSPRHLRRGDPPAANRHGSLLERIEHRTDELRGWCR